MGFRFRKSLKIAPGVRLNMGRTGLTSASFGPRGLKMNVGTRGVRTTVGLPGTGISYTSSTAAAPPSRKKAAAGRVLTTPPVQIVAVAKPQNSRKVLKTLGAILLAFVVGAVTHWSIGLLLAVGLIFMIFRSRTPRSIAVPTASAEAPDAPSVMPVNRAAPAQERLYLTASTRLYANPDNKSKHLAELYGNQLVTILGRQPGWMYVHNNFDVQGWARDESWQPVAPA